MGTLTFSPTTWTNGNVTITGKATDVGSGLIAYQFSQSSSLSASSGGWTNISNTKEEITKTYSVSSNGTYYFYVKDAAGNINKKSVVISKIDKTKPTITTPTISNVSDGSFTVSTTFNDANSGLSKIVVYYKTSSSSTYTSKTTTYTTMNGGTTGSTGNQTKSITLNGLENANSYNIYVVGYDVAGNSVQSSIITINEMCIEDGLIRHYDAINNTGNGHSSSTKTWVDLSNEKIDGIMNGGTIYSNFVSLDGIDDWVNMGQVTNKTAITLEATIMLKELPEGDRSILGNQQNGGACIELIDKGSLEFHVYIPNVGYVGVTSNEKLSVNQIYTITGTYDGQTIKLFVNGELKASTSATGTIGNPQDNTVMSLGTNPYKDQPGADEFANINAYSIKIYEKALSTNEVQFNYQKNKERFNMDTQYASANDLIIHYDGLNNIKKGSEQHSNTTTTWKNLVKDTNDGGLKGATVFSNYVSLDGNNDWINMNQIKDKNKLTLEITITPKSIQNGTVYLLGNWQAGGFGIGLNNGKPYFEVYISGGTAYKSVTSNTVLQPNKTYTITAVYDGTALKLYINGELTSSLNASGTIKNPQDNTVTAIGTNPYKDQPGLDGFANMNIYSVRVYERGLSQQEVITNYEVNRKRFNF